MILSLCKNNKYYLTNQTKFINLFFPFYKNKHYKDKGISSKVFIL